MPPHPLHPGAEDNDMLRQAALLTRDLHGPNPLIYWIDCFGSAAIGYAALLGAIASGNAALTVALVLLSISALYRAVLFIHEITHLDHRLLPGFRTAWNVGVGATVLLPSFLYEGIHAVHHSRVHYGTERDPEYLPLAHMRPWTLPLFTLAAVLMPALLLLRFGILGPLSWVIPPLRRLLVERFSSLEVNPAYRRPAPEGAFARRWVAQEAAASVVAIAILATAALGIMPLRAFALYCVVVAGVALLNQTRTLVAHLWENDGGQLSLTDQYRDSTNVPPAFPGALWAPVGLRFHALHHLLPRLPYHALPEAHRRLKATLPAPSAYHEANYRSLTVLLVRLGRATVHRGKDHPVPPEGSQHPC
ncbi:fatty acid desaturase family protein [Pseudoblastomonas halimionae]|uniref:Fatty acid desaturase n=1 Tax=Alteriqipengyuania halimionae TaxID=1926630 RepID=A0A6I4U833_9SPHN|nr:fatty acid desaturase [Alteriqipengyuania halimionae]MXP10407.1 fatty acid desaturase [Alteriqipengyuania halimionae]